MGNVAPRNRDALFNSQRRSKNRHAARETSQIFCTGEMCCRDSATGRLGCETFAERLSLVRLFQGVVDGDEVAFRDPDSFGLRAGILPQNFEAPQKKTFASRAATL